MSLSLLPECPVVHTPAQYSKIGKVIRHITLQPPGRIPRDEEFAFRARARALVDKWHLIVRNAKKEEGSGKNDTVPSEGDKADAMNGVVATPAALKIHQ